MTDIKELSHKQNFIWNTIGNLIYLGCQWLTTVMVVILSSGYNNSGILAFAMAIGLIFSSLGGYCTRPFQVSDVKGQFSNQNYIAFRIITDLLAFFICCIYAFVVSDDFSIVSTSIVYLIFKFDENLADVFFGIYQSNYRMDYLGTSQICRGVLSISIFCTSLYVSNNLLLAILLMWVGCLSVTIFYDLPHISRFGRIKPNITLNVVKKMFKTCFFNMLTGFILAFLVSGVRQIYGLTSGTEMLGIYAAIATPAVIIQVGANYVNAPFFRDLAIWRNKGKNFFVKKYFKLVLLMILVIGLLIAIVGIAGNFVLPILYGSSIVEYMYTFPFVLIATAGVGLLYFVYDTFIALRDNKKLVSVVVLGASLTLCSSYPLICVFGMNGVNLSIILGTYTACIIGYILIAKSKSI